ncbi:hypothetical protein EST38_g667 [Candolleomyces aberdarensis]|uniref:RRM domain-containing protein n=1 Tax=Candolleomyces aberdarensis TaxID=2316362 RepID=A0A4Q2DXS9_9AGAR|nr:hypothetical protein EST38_g667 [Candolleomyces aberdarensis]
MSRGRSLSPGRGDVDIDMDARSPNDKTDAKVVVVTNLTRNVVEVHLQTVFGFYGEITKIDLPLFGKSGQNRGKAALEYADASSARKATSPFENALAPHPLVVPAMAEFEVAPSRAPVLLETSPALLLDPVREHALAQGQNPHLSEEAAAAAVLVAVAEVDLEDEVGLLEVVTVTVTAPTVQAQIVPALVHQFAGVDTLPQLAEDVLQAIVAEVSAVAVPFAYAVLLSPLSFSLQIPFVFFIE